MVLLLDNYDSFTYNLLDYIQQLGKACKVIRNDEMTLQEIENINFESIVISPGPCIPETSGITMDLIQKYHETKAILGVCLGHQALGQFFGAKLVKAPKPMHGKVSAITVNTQHYLFKNLPAKIEVMRYHSLILEEVNAPMNTIAHTAHNEIMAIAHKNLPLAGVQFHPESILSKDGIHILKNWFEHIQ